MPDDFAEMILYDSQFEKCCTGAATALFFCHRFVVSISRHVNRMLGGSNVPKLTIFQQFFQQALSSGLHLRTEHLELSASDGFVSGEVVG